MLGERALELARVALDRLARDAFGEGKAMAALRAKHLFFGVDDDGAGHATLLQKFGVRAGIRSRLRGNRIPALTPVCAG